MPVGATSCMHSCDRVRERERPTSIRDQTPSHSRMFVEQQSNMVKVRLHLDAQHKTCHNKITQAVSRVTLSCVCRLSCIQQRLPLTLNSWHATSGFLFYSKMLVSLSFSLSLTHSQTPNALRRKVNLNVSECSLFSDCYYRQYCLQHRTTR